MRKQIKDFPNYSVDTEGNVYGHDGMMKSHISKKGKGYFSLILRSVGVKSYQKVSRLVAKTFIPNLENKPYVCHKNGNRLDDRVENLYWGTAHENSMDAVRQGTHPGFLNKGEKSHFAKLDETKVRFVKRALVLGIKQTEIAKILNISAPTITDIKKGKSWKHVISGWAKYSNQPSYGS